MLIQYYMNPKYAASPGFNYFDHCLCELLLQQPLGLLDLDQPAVDCPVSQILLRAQMGRYVGQHSIRGRE